MSVFATGPAWDRAGRPDWISRTEQTDQDNVSTGCGIVYIYGMLSLGFPGSRIAQAGGDTFSANYQALTGKTSAYKDLLAAVQGVASTRRAAGAAPGRGFRPRGFSHILPAL